MMGRGHFLHCLCFNRKSKRVPYRAEGVVLFWCLILSGEENCFTPEFCTTEALFMYMQEGM